MYDELLNLRDDYNKIRESIDNAYNDVIDTVIKKSEIIDAVFARHPEFKEWWTYSGTMKNYDAALRLLDVVNFSNRRRRRYYCPDDYASIDSVFLFDNGALNICIGCEWEYLRIPKEVLDLEGDEFEAYVEKTITEGVKEWNAYMAINAHIRD